MWQTIITFITLNDFYFWNAIFAKYNCFQGILQNSHFLTYGSQYSIVRTVQYNTVGTSRSGTSERGRPLTYKFPAGCDYCNIFGKLLIFILVFEGKKYR